jgi:hypothetical protein
MAEKNPLLKELEKDLFYYKINIHNKPHPKKVYKNLKNHPEPQLLDPKVTVNNYVEKKKEEIKFKAAEQMEEPKIVISKEDKPVKKNLIQEISPEEAQKFNQPKKQEVKKEVK